MISNIITDETKVVQVSNENLIRFNEFDVNKFNSIALSLTNETGVPKKLIYTAPYMFFLDRWHKIDGDWYYFKAEDHDFYLINELMGEVISQYFGLQSVHYKIAQLNVNGENKGYGVISKNFSDPNSVYQTAWDFRLQPSDDLSILKNIKNICIFEDEYSLLLDDMKKLFIRDFYTSQRDRTVNNFLFRVDDNGVRLAPLYEYECSFEAVDKAKYSNPIGELNLSNPETKKIMQ